MPKFGDKQPFRFDLLNWSAKKQEDGTYHYHLELDSTRYRHCRDANHELAIEDKLTGDVYLWEDIAEVLDKMPKESAFPPVILPYSNPSYMEFRIRQLQNLKRLDISEMSLKSTNPSPESKIINSFFIDSIHAAILCVDICSSTTISQNLHTRDYARLISLFNHEVYQTITDFHGTVLKPIGDELLCYFNTDYSEKPHANSVACYECASFLLPYIVVALNNLYISLHLPSICVRIAIDLCNCEVIPGIHGCDLAGGDINLLKKIQGSCEPNEIRVGHSIKKMLNATQQNQCQLIDSTFLSLETEITEYQVYRVKETPFHPK